MKKTVGGYNKFLFSLLMETLKKARRKINHGGVD